MTQITKLSNSWSPPKVKNVLTSPKLQLPPLYTKWSATENGNTPLQVLQGSYPGQDRGGLGWPRCGGTLRAQNNHRGIGRPRQGGILMVGFREINQELKSQQLHLGIWKLDSLNLRFASHSHFANVTSMDPVLHTGGLGHFFSSRKSLEAVTGMTLGIIPQLIRRKPTFGSARFPMVHFSQVPSGQPIVSMCVGQVSKSARLGCHELACWFCGTGQELQCPEIAIMLGPDVSSQC